MEKNRSAQLYQDAKRYFPGGVNSPVRSGSTVNSLPVYIEKGNGPYVYDENGRQYLDFISAYGPNILGHGDPGLAEVLTHQIEKGLQFGCNHASELGLAEQIIKAFPEQPMMRFSNSGTEAVMTAIRLARGFTGKKKIIKFAGCYHGHVDALLVEAGSGLLTHGQPNSQGIPRETVQNTLILPFNDVNALQQVFEQNANDIAGVILEIVPGNVGVIHPGHAFLTALQDLSKQNRALLIADEIMTGFRALFGGAQHVYKVKPDITCLGKIIGGGFPIGAVCSREEIMNKLSPVGGVYHAGTFAGHPLAMTAGQHVLKRLNASNAYDPLLSLAHKLELKLKTARDQFKWPIQVHRYGSMLSIHFTPDEVTDYLSAQKTNTQLYTNLYKYCLQQGLLLPPSAFESWFLSLAYEDEHIEDAGKIIAWGLENVFDENNT